MGASLMRLLLIALPPNQEQPLPSLLVLIPQSRPDHSPQVVLGDRVEAGRHLSEEDLLMDVGARRRRSRC